MRIGPANRNLDDMVQFIKGDIGIHLDLSPDPWIISKEQDKIVFLNKLKKLIKEKWDKHRPLCKDPSKCLEEEENGFSLLVIDQYMESIADSYEYQPEDRSDRFSADDISNLNLKIDQILRKLEEHDCKW